ncbi:hypothetical protein [Bradyrhizobium sp. Tv2a-2]|uniref:hypothetical protein n=1 Tax=Bradyrhizobium sp. Tv2a-2 TaxID=113395 RepID=UPI000467067F|nr:hypothetical protein [Bradyrhizobium sp. Tv2a-2]
MSAIGPKTGFEPNVGEQARTADPDATAFESAAQSGTRGAHLGAPSASSSETKFVADNFLIQENHPLARGEFPPKKQAYIVTDKLPGVKFIEGRRATGGDAWADVDELIDSPGSAKSSTKNVVDVKPGDSTENIPARYDQITGSRKGVKGRFKQFISHVKARRITKEGVVEATFDQAQAARRRSLAEGPSLADKRISDDEALRTSQLQERLKLQKRLEKDSSGSDGSLPRVEDQG